MSGDGDRPLSRDRDKALRLAEGRLRATNAAYDHLAERLLKTERAWAADARRIGVQAEWLIERAGQIEAADALADAVEGYPIAHIQEALAAYRARRREGHGERHD